MTAKAGRKWGELRGDYVEIRQLAAVLRDVADSRGVTLRLLQDRMPYGRTAISQNLSGATRPEWRFVVVLLDACTGTDRQARKVLERKIRPLWDAAAPTQVHRIAEISNTPHDAVASDIGAWVAALHDAAGAQLVVARAQLSVSRHYDLVTGLLQMLNRLTEATKELSAERDALRREILARDALAEDLRRTRALLDDTQLRLDAAESLQVQTSHRLNEALRQRVEAEQLKHDAIVQAGLARRRLARLERQSVEVQDDVGDEKDPATDEISTLMGRADQGLADAILRRVDDVLGEEAVTLDELRDEVVGQVQTSQKVPALSVGQLADNVSATVDKYQERYRSLMKAGAQVAWVTTSNGETAEDSPEWRRITGQSVTQYLQAGWLAAIHPEDSKLVERDWLECIRTGVVFNALCRVRTKSGSYRHYNIRAVPVERNGAIVEWVGASTDVTTQREADEMRGRLTETLSAAALRTSRLQQATSLLAEALSVQEVISVIADIGRSAIGASRSVVALADKDRLSLRIISSDETADGPNALGGEISLDQPSVMTSAVGLRRPVILDSPEGWQVHFGTEAIAKPFLRHSDDRAWVGLPLTTSGPPLGALQFSFTNPRRINDEERVFLEALAGQSALALERAMLYEREHTTAETLQRSLLPDNLPEVPGVALGALYQPLSTLVGGDWYDAFRLPNGMLAVAVGDVMGKGLTAAARMGRVKDALRALALTDPRPAAVLAGLDRLFLAPEFDEQVTTVCYLVIDPESGEGVAGNAGHPPPLLLGSGMAPSLDPAEAGTPLGWASPRQQYPFRVPHDSAVVLYSDGLVQSRMRDLDVGLDELVAVATHAPRDVVEDAGKLIDYLVDRMLAEYEQDDDVTLLVLQVLAKR